MEFDKHNENACNVKYTIQDFVQNFTSDIHITSDY